MEMSEMVEKIKSKALAGAARKAASEQAKRDKKYAEREALRIVGRTSPNLLKRVTALIEQINASFADEEEPYEKWQQAMTHLINVLDRDGLEIPTFEEIARCLR
jgi:hypothetical protein